MGKYTGPKNKIARRFGLHLGLKTNATKVARRLQQKPGVHGATYKRSSVSSFGKQLIEKQKAKYIYGLRERQFRSYVQKASRLKGDSSVAVQRLLEMRLDNVVYRMGFAGTRAQARQMVNHGLFVVNGKKMNIPSHTVKVGDEIGIKASKKTKKIFEGLSERLAKVDVASWLALNPALMSGKVLSLPQADDFEKLFDIKLIIEYYSSR
ncbi:MAG: 30S ribosomal protein S4 [Candidatus Magasanikbacteria bacterium]|nr:30S ribosomal protein S4 [Candidatus Magasanikbacteria bacterium]